MASYVMHDPMSRCDCHAGDAVWAMPPAPTCCS